MEPKFEKVQYRRFSKRVVAQFEKNSIEEIAVNELSQAIKETFNVRYANRESICLLLFDTIKAIEKLDDFTIVKFDFEKYFYSVSTHYMYVTYIENSDLTWENKKTFLAFSKNFPFCVPGLSISNVLCELVARDFDKALEKRTHDLSVFFYRRYVDDGILILSEFIGKDKVDEILLNCISEVFNKNNLTDNRVKLNTRKTCVINRRNINPITMFEYLGYSFTLERRNPNGCTVKYGIANSKRAKIQKEIQELIRWNLRDRRRLFLALKLYSSRLVFNAGTSRNPKWISKGVCSTYKLLSTVKTRLDDDTKIFLESVIQDELYRRAIVTPFRINIGRKYSLLDGIQNNRAIILDNRIGMSKPDFVRVVKKSGVIIDIKKEYRGIVLDVIDRLGLHKKET